MTNLSEFFPTVPVYTPAMMEFDGSTGYYSKTGITTSGNKVTFVVRFKIPSFTSAAAIVSHAVGATHQRMQVYLLPSDHATTTKRNKLGMHVVNSSGVVICSLFSASDLADGALHTALLSFDGDAGTAVFRVDGVDEDDTGNPDRVAPTTGTLDSSASSACGIGAFSSGANLADGEIGFAGYRDAYLTNWSDFMHPNGNPKALDEFGWTEWGGGTFAPPMQEFDGSTGYYNKSFTSSGDDITVLARFSVPSFAGDTYQVIGKIDGPTSKSRGQFTIYSSDHSGVPARAGDVAIYIQNSAGATLVNLYTDVGQLIDGAEHTLFFSFDGSTGGITLAIDGGVASYVELSATTSGTLESGASSELAIGAFASGSNTLDGEIGFFGHREAYLTNWSDFMDANGNPKALDESSWTEWGAQPLFWNKYGAMDDNKGSEGDMTKNGTITHTPYSQPLLWNEHGELDNNLGSAGNMTRNGTIIVGKGGN